MSGDDARKHAEQHFKARAANDKSTVPDYEARSRDIRQKIEYLRSLRLASQARSKGQNGPSQ